MNGASQQALNRIIWAKFKIIIYFYARNIWQMAFQFKNDMSLGVNLDLDQLRLPQNATTFIKNATRNFKANAGSPAGAGSNQDVYTPLEGNTQLTITLPSGSNFCIGFYSSEQTNEGYFFVYNSNNSHTIWVISGDTGTITKVYQDNLSGNVLLPFSLNPKYFIAEGRCTLELRSFTDPVSGNETNFKFLIFTNNEQNQFLIEVGSSIATTSFSTSFFSSFSAFYNPIELIHLGVPTPLKCMGLDTPNAYSPTDEDKLKQNLLVRNGYQFRIKTIDFYGRESEHGIISDVFTPIIGGACISTSNSLPRCVNLNFDAGNPMVNTIQVEFRKWVGDDRAGALDSGWNIYDIFTKYDNSSGEWYTRSFNPLFTTSGSGVTFNAGTNTITYTFCADKSSIPIDPNETSRTEPGLPRYSGSVFSVNKRIGLANNVRDFDPIPQDEIEKVVFSAQAPSTTGYCAAAPTRSITFYANIYSPWDDSSQMVRQSYDLVVFGGSDAGGGCDYSSGSHTSSIRLGQVFGDQVHPGFIGYLAGTPYKCISEQGDFDPSTGVFQYQGYSGPSLNFPHQKMQKFVITDVPAGKYVIRIASHRSTVNDPDYQKTSTYVAGVTDISNLTVSGGRKTGYASNPIKEIEIDCTAGDVTLNGTSDPMFVILDLGNGDQSGAVDGYLYEQPGGAPVEMSPVKLYGTGALGVSLDAYGSFFTDHNGFYFAASPIITYAELWADFCDGSGLEKKIFLVNGAYSIKHGDGTGSLPAHCWGDNGNWKNQVYLAQNAAFGYGSYANPFPDVARRRVRQNIYECADHSIGVPGVPVVMTKGATGITNTSGYVELIAHSRYSYASFTDVYLYSYVPDYSGSPNNVDVLIFSQKGGCQWTACSDCDTYLSDASIIYLACADGSYGCPGVTGKIAGSSLFHPGSGYAVNDTFTVDGGSTPATGKITAITGSAVLFYEILTEGAGYSLGTATTTATLGGGTGFEILITETDPPARTVCLPDVYVVPSWLNISGVQSGAKYPCAFWLHDAIGRHTPPQVRQFNFGFVDIPNLNDTTYQKFLLSQIRVDIDPSFSVDPIFTKMTFLVGANVLFTDFFSWAADWVQPVDNTGNTNNVNPTAIRIYYGSLNEYNKQNNFSTNCNWQFLSDSTSPNSSPVEGDIVQFIMNGDGAWIDSVVSAPVTYDKSGLFFTIEYLPELANLKNNCLFRVIRPNPNTSSLNVPLYEQCLTIPVVDGVPSTLSATLPYKDSYLLQRLLPVPRLKGQPNAISPSVFPATPQLIQYTSSNQDSNLDTSGYSTNNVNNANGVAIFDIIDDATSYPFPFESPSPADTWGSHMANRGRVGVANSYAEQSRNGTEIALSDALGDRPNSFNGLSYFESSNSFTFDKQTWGNITSVMVETSNMLVICESDHFITRFNSTQLRTDAAGNIIAQNPYGIFTAPERKSGENFGCTEFNINSIRKYQGKVFWLDAKGRLIMSDFYNSIDVSREDKGKGILGGYNGYLINKIATLNVSNNNPSNGTWFFIGGIDPYTMEYYLTSFRYKQLGSPDYINQASGINLSGNETLIIDMADGRLKGTASFTPEMYGMIPGYYNGKNFFSFETGSPFKHHAGVGSVPLYAKFFGTQCEVRFNVVCNISSEKDKRYFWMEIYTAGNIAGSVGTLPTALFISDTITTESGQLSRLALQRWDIRNKFQTAQFICDLNTPADSNIPIQTGAHKILDGNPLIGRWLQANMVTQSGYAGTYFELSAVVIYGNAIEKSAD